MFTSLSDKKLLRIAECRRYTIKINIKNSKTSKIDIEAAEQVKTQGILGLFIVIDRVHFFFYHNCEANSFSTDTI